MVSISNTNDLENLFPNARVTFLSSPSTGSLQFLNIRVTKRLHRYRLLKRQWNELTTTVHNFESLLPTSDIVSSSQAQITEGKDHIPSTGDITMKENSNDLGPLHSQIQKDLFQLGGLIRARQKRLTETLSQKTNTTNRLSREEVSYFKHKSTLLISQLTKKNISL